MHLTPLEAVANLAADLDGQGHCPLVETSNRIGGEGLKIVLLLLKHTPDILGRDCWSASWENYDAAHCVAELQGRVDGFDLTKGGLGLSLEVQVACVVRSELG